MTLRRPYCGAVGPALGPGLHQATGPAAPGITTTTQSAIGRRSTLCTPPKNRFSPSQIRKLGNSRLTPGTGPENRGVPDSTNPLRSGYGAPPPPGPGAGRRRSDGKPPAKWRRESGWHPPEPRATPVPSANRATDGAIMDEMRRFSGHRWKPPGAKSSSPQHVVEQDARAGQQIAAAFTVGQTQAGQIAGLVQR